MSGVKHVKVSRDIMLNSATRTIDVLFAFPGGSIVSASLVASAPEDVALIVDQMGEMFSAAVEDAGQAVREHRNQEDS